MKNRILIVDDDRNTLEIMAQTLAPYYEVQSAGSAEEALQLLRDENRDREEQLAEAQMAAGRDRIRILLEEDRLRIRLLRAKPVSPETVAELREVYARAAGLAERYQTELGLLYDYTDFLCEEKDYRTAIPVGERLRGYQARDGVSAEKRAALDNLLGRLYDENSGGSPVRLCAECGGDLQQSGRFAK